MDIGKLLGNLKGKVMDANHFELLKHAYDLQEQNIIQLKNNNAALKESNELYKEKDASYIEKINFLEEENLTLSEAVKAIKIPKEDDKIVLSENAAKILECIVQSDATDFYQNQIVDVVGIGKINAEAGLDELSNYGLVRCVSAHRHYGLHYHLTEKAKRSLASK